MLTAEYANTIRLLEEIGRTAEKEDRFSAIQSAIKILRVELDREMDIKEMSRFRTEVVLLDPSSEHVATTARREGRAEREDYAPPESRFAESDVREERGMRRFTPPPVKSDDTGIRSVEERQSGGRRSFIRETDNDRIRVKLSSMKIEKIAASEHSSNEGRNASSGGHEAEETRGLVKCKNCGAMISSRSVVCVSCGEFIR